MEGNGKEVKVVITLTYNQFEVLKKLLPIAKEAISRQATIGEAVANSDKVEWTAAEVKFTIA